MLPFLSESQTKLEDRSLGGLTALEMKRAENACILLVQKECFSEQIRSLKNKAPNDHIEYKNVRIFLSNGILYVKSRLASNPDKSDKLILLPNDHYFTELLVWSNHRERYHAGCKDLVAFIRQRFCIVRIKQTITKIIRNCAICKRWAIRHYNAEVSPLPVERITISRVFSVCGLDFLGHCLVYDSNEATKAYILLFSCATTRSIHLELVSNMSVQSFLLAFKRFIGRRGLPAVLISDNFSSFKKANQDLIEAWKNVDSVEFNDYLTTKRIEWKFIVECAPFWGGFYERMVKSVKIPLRKILRTAKVNSEELNTLIIEIESLLNNRPLTYMYSNPDEFEPLTPSHFLVGRRLDGIPPVYDRLEGKNDLEERYKLLEEIKDKFWQQWSQEYLPELTYYAQSRKTNVRDINVGDIVLIGSEKSRGKWRMGKIQTLKYGKDGKVRAAQVKTSGKKLLNRPMQQLYPLETAHSAESSQSSPLPPCPRALPVPDASRVDTPRVVTPRVFTPQASETNEPDADVQVNPRDAHVSGVKMTRSDRQVKPSVTYSRDDFIYDVDNL